MSKFFFSFLTCKLVVARPRLMPLDVKQKTQRLQTFREDVGLIRDVRDAQSCFKLTNSRVFGAIMPE